MCSFIIITHSTLMGEKDELCVIQKWDLDEDNCQGMLHLRTKQSRQKRILNISFRDHDFLEANAMFKRYRVFFLKPWMKINKSCIYNHGSAFKSHQNKEAKNLLFQMTNQEIEELKAKNLKMAQQWNLKYQQAVIEKDSAKIALERLIEQREIGKQATRLMSNQIQRLRRQVRRLRGEDAQVNLVNLLVDQPNNCNNRQHQGLFVGYGQWRR